MIEISERLIGWNSRNLTLDGNSIGPVGEKIYVQSSIYTHVLCVDLSSLLTFFLIFGVFESGSYTYVLRVPRLNIFEKGNDIY